MLKSSANKPIYKKPILQPYNANANNRGSTQRPNKLVLATVKRTTQKKNKRKPRMPRNNDFAETSYLKSLLVPEFAVNTKIPGSAIPVVTIHRKIVFRSLTNNLGNFSLTFVPPTLQDNSGSANCYNFWYNNVVNYDAAAVAAVPTVVPLANPFSLPAFNVRAYRLVSSSIICRSLQSNLNRTGDMHISTLPMTINAIGNTAPNADFVNYAVLTNIDNQSNGCYKQAHIENGEFVRAIYIPQDVSCLDFLSINTNLATTNAAGTENCIQIIGIGLTPATNVEFEAFFNFELIPCSGSVLLGLESICMHNNDPLQTWRTLRTKYRNNITMATPLLSAASNLATSLRVASSII